MSDLSRGCFFHYVSLKAADQVRLTMSAALKSAGKLESQLGWHQPVPCSKCGKPFQSIREESTCPTCEGERKQQSLAQEIPIT